tara:strand:- start:178 stop:516 length:339 start_codon:yes stop_codon:yes gene_type:complete
MNTNNFNKIVDELFCEIQSEYDKQEVNEGLSSAMNALLKFLLTQVRKGTFQRNYDVDVNSGRLKFTTKGGKEIIINDAKLGILLFKTWKNKKDKEFFDYSEHSDILKFALKS